MRSRIASIRTRFCTGCSHQCRRPREPECSAFSIPRCWPASPSSICVAKTVVDGFVAGLHRSPDFGFSQEFAEYRAYTPGDDLRHVDWNVFARTERCYLKRYRGETNSQLTILLDASNSMKYTSGPPTKMDYARFIAASLFYLAIHNQRDAAGLIVFDDEVRNYIRPSTRQGQLHRLFARPGTRRTPRAHRFRQAAAALPEFSASPRHRASSSPISTKTLKRSSTPSSRCAFTATRSCSSTSSTRRRFGRR